MCKVLLLPTIVAKFGSGRPYAHIDEKFLDEERRSTQHLAKNYSANGAGCGGLFKYYTKTFLWLTTDSYFGCELLNSYYI